MFLWPSCVDRDKGGGVIVVFQLANRSRGRSKAGFLGTSFIHLSLSSHDKGQALTKAEVRTGSVTSSWPVSPSQPLVWRLPTVYQPAEHLSSERRGPTDTRHRKVAHSGGTGLTSQDSYIQKSDVTGVDVRYSRKTSVHKDLSAEFGQHTQDISISSSSKIHFCVSTTKSPTTCQILHVKIASD